MVEPIKMSIMPGLRHQRVPMADIRSQLLEAVERKNECDLEELMQFCPWFTWNQVFLEVDRLSRTGELRPLLKKSGVYKVRLPA